MHETADHVHRAGHLALVVPAKPSPSAAAPGARTYLTTTRCRPSELPGTVALRLTDEALAIARAASRSEGVELSTWVRLAVECARQARRAAGLFGVDLAEVHDLLDAAAAESPTTEPVAVAPLAAYIRSLRQGAARAERTGTVAELLVPVPDELVVGWNAAAVEAGSSLEAWASAQVLAAPSGVVSWEVAAARSGCYLGEWVLAASASSSARRSSALPQA